MGKIFERELKGILSANDDVLNRVTKTCDPEEKAGYLKIREKPFMVVRGAGSLGVDLVAISAGLSFPIEVKSSTSDVLRFSRNEKLIIQANEMIENCHRVGLIPVYAFRYKRQRGDAWRVFTFETDGLDARMRLVYQRLPKITVSREGNHIMRWKEGLPLYRFIDYVVDIQK